MLIEESESDADAASHGLALACLSSWQDKQLLEAGTTPCVWGWAVCISRTQLLPRGKKGARLWEGPIVGGSIL